MNQRRHWLLLLLFCAVSIQADVPAFSKCIDGSSTIKCYYIEDVTADTLLRPMTPEKKAVAKHGFSLETSLDGKTWDLQIAYDGIEECKITIGPLIGVECNQDREKPFIGVTVTGYADTRKGTFRIVSADSNEPVEDALGLYMIPKVAVTISGKVGVGPVKQFKLDDLQLVPECFDATNTEKPNDGLAEIKKMAGKATNLASFPTKFECTQDYLKEIYFGKDRIKAPDDLNTIIYCSKSGWRNGNGQLLDNSNQHKKQPYCWNILGFECGELVHCSLEMNANLYSGDGLRLDTTKEKKWELSYANKKFNQDECRLFISYHQEKQEQGFKCKSDTIPPDVNGVITIPIEPKDTSVLMSKEYQIYKQSLHFFKVKGKLRNGKVDSLTLRVGGDRYYAACEATTTTTPNEHAKKAIDNDGEYTCPFGNRFSKLYIGTAMQTVSALYCSVQGWCDKDGKVLGKLVLTPDKELDALLCWNEIPPLPIFDNCNDAKTKMCIIFEEEFKTTKEPSKLTRLKASSTTIKQGIYIDMANDNEWIVTVAWPIEFAECYVALPGFPRFNCDPRDDFALENNGVKIEKGDAIGRYLDVSNKEKDSEQTKFKITSPANGEPIFDALELYKSDKQAFVMELKKLPADPLKTLTGNIDFDFGCDYKTTSTFSAETAELAQRDMNKKYTCPGHLNNIIYFNDEMTVDKLNAVVCTKKGWRDEKLKFVLEMAEPTVYCYTDKKKFGPIKMFEKCDTTECFVKEDGSTEKLVKTSTIPSGETTVGIDLDMTNKMKWTLKISQHPTEICKFSLGEVLKFDCNNKDDFSKIFDKVVTVTLVKSSRTKADYNLNIEEYTIESVDVKDSVVDALRLYEKIKEKMTITDSGATLETPEITFFQACTPDTNPNNLPQDATKVIMKENAYTCQDNPLMKDIFFDGKLSGLETAYCSDRGWRKSDHTIHDEKISKSVKIHCYTSDPSSALPIFKSCENPSKRCFTYLQTKNELTLVKDTQNKQTLGVEIDMTDPNVWIVLIAWNGPASACNFVIGEMNFDCKQLESATTPVGKVTVTKMKQGKDGTIIYEKYQITSSNSLDPNVLDALELYEKLKVTVSLKIDATEYSKNDVEFFKECVLSDFSLTNKWKKADKANREVNKFECKDPILDTIFVNVDPGTVEPTSFPAKTMYCSQAGWRDKSKKLVLPGTVKDKPICYTQAEGTAIIMFDDCGNKECYILQGPSDLTRYPKILDYMSYTVGFDLDHSDDSKWTFIVYYEKVDGLSFKIGNSALYSVGSKVAPNEDPITFPGVTIKLIKKAQDGTVFYYKFTLEPKSGESLIDNLKLYEKEDYNIVLTFTSGTTTPLTTSTGIKFFSKCQGDGTKGFTLARMPTFPARVHNKFECSDGNSIFMNNKFIPLTEIHCSKKGWRKSGGQFYENFDSENIYCFNRCDDEFMDKTDESATKVTLLQAGGNSEYTCPHSSIQIKETYHSKVTCAGHKWKGDSNIDPDPVTYKISAKCFGSFTYVDNNCVSNEDIQKGCIKPTLTNDVITCKPGYVLSFNNKIHTSLQLVKDQWMSGPTKDKKAERDEYPKCLSICRKENIDVNFPKETKWGSTASYKWKQSDNTGELKCDDATDILFANFESLYKSYSKDWKCDAKTGWSSDQTTIPLPGAFKKPAELKFKAHCVQACTPKRVKTDVCGSDTECAQAIYQEHKLRCPSDQILIVNNQYEFSHELECSALGWRKKGEPADSPVLPKFDHSVQADRDGVLNAQCFDRCSTRFRSGDTKEDLTYLRSTSLMECAGTKMISYTVKPNPAETTLENLYCESKIGWKDKSSSGPLLIDFKNGYMFKAECVDSCTQNLIQSNCGSQPNCDNPKMDTDRITCGDATKILESDGQYEYKGIKCTKASFESDNTFIKKDRTDSDMKIEVKCISKCDKKFVKLETDATSQLTPETGSNSYDIECKADTKHPVVYTKLTTPKRVFYTATKFECDPATGWSAIDITNGLVADFTIVGEHFRKAEAKCVDVCIDRFKENCDIGNSNCLKPEYLNGKISCGDKHTMSVEGEEMIDETLECIPKGYKRKSQPTIRAFDFVHLDPIGTFDMHCFYNCYEKLVAWKGAMGINNQEEMKCHSDDELLVVAPSKAPTAYVRVFGEAKCEAAVGWKGEVAKSLSETENKKLIDFKKDVRLAAACHKVCSDDIVKDTCDEKPKCTKSQYASKKLSCSPNHRLFISHGTMLGIETGDVKCSRRGWTKEPNSETVINFLDAAVDFTENVNALCKHKCHPDFITTSCDAVGRAAKTCSDVTYENDKMTCAGDYDIVVLEYVNSAGENIRSESFGTAICSDNGWTSETKDESHPKTDVMFNPDNDKYHIKAKCENVCHPSTLTYGNTQPPPDYKLGEKLTCTDEFKMLVFEDNKWYTDLLCTKYGWKSNDPTLHPDAKIEFKANERAGSQTTDDAPRKFKAECMDSACVRGLVFGGKENPCKDFVPPPATPEEKCAKKPNWEKNKYVMTCQQGMSIARLSDSNLIIDKPIIYSRLHCKNDIWYKDMQSNPQKIVEPSDAFDFFCFSRGCSKCEDSRRNSKIACDPSDRNCKEIKFEKRVNGCSRYKCPDDYSYKIEQEGKSKYYLANVNDVERAITCDGQTDADPKVDIFHSPDGNNQLGPAEKFGCVERIPCIEHSPINTECPSLLVNCDSDGLNKKLIDGSSNPFKEITCDSDKQLFKKVDDNPWTLITKLQCNKEGQWDVFVTEPGQNEETKEKKALPEKNARVVCADNDPNTTPPPPPTTTPKPGVCESCALPPVLKCEGCDKDRSKTKTETDGETCKMTSTTGRFAFNDGSETKEPLTCQEANNATSVFFVWKTIDGKTVNQVASITRTIDQVDKALIGGIVSGVLLLLISIGAFIAFIVVRKKREAQRLETLKSKGLEQKNDTIIDSMTIIEDPKTIRL